MARQAEHALQTSLTEPSVRPLRALRHKRLMAWLFTLPGLIAQVVFGWLPVAFAFVVAFQRYYFVKEPEFIGLRNLTDVVADPLVKTAFFNTFYFALLAIGLTFFLPIFISILLMEMPRRVIRVMMILWFLPVAATASIAI